MSINLHISQHLRENGSMVPLFKSSHFYLLLSLLSSESSPITPKKQFPKKILLSRSISFSSVNLSSFPGKSRHWNFSCSPSVISLICIIRRQNWKRKWGEGAQECEVYMPEFSLENLSSMQIFYQLCLKGQYSTFLFLTLKIYPNFPPPN